MPLNSPEDYVRLGAHLAEIDGVFRQFLAGSGYSDNTGRLGRYPHRSAILEGKIQRKIDLQMDHDLNDQKFDEFFPDIPYTLWAGAWLDEGDWRYSNGGFRVFEHLPFSKVKDVFAESFAQAARRLEPVTESSLKDSGKRTPLRRS